MSKELDIGSQANQPDGNRPIDPTRRQFMGMGLVAPLLHRRQRNKRSKHQDERLYHGPLKVSPEVVALAYRCPVAKTTHRKLATRASHAGVTYVFRALGGDTYLGEIVRTQQGTIRVHVWSIVDCPDAKRVEDIVAWKADGVETPREERQEDATEEFVTDRDDLTEQYS